MTLIFGRPVPELYMICNTVTDWIYAHHSHRITQWNRTILNPLELEKYAEAVFSKGAPLSNFLVSWMELCAQLLDLGKTND